MACVLISKPALAASTAPKHSVIVGIGNSMGWLGAQSERYFVRGHASGFIGLGYSLGLGEESGVAVAAGVRLFTPGFRHRGFVELSLSQIAVEGVGSGEFVDRSRLYGPGLQVGYQRVSKSGLTLLLSAGLGRAVGPRVGNTIQPLLGLGVGYTWH